MMFSYVGRSGLPGRRAALLLALGIFLWELGITGCLVLRREKIPVSAPIAAGWKVATLQELLDRLRTQENAIQSLDAVATIEPSVSAPSKGEIVHYRDVRSFILIRKPDSIRMIGLYPVVQNKAFDMTSDGETFRLYIPSKNRFIIGRTANQERSQSPLENLRPQHILEALLLKAPEAGKEEAVMEAFSNDARSYYILHILRRAPGEPPVLARNIWFERRGLAVERLQIFDGNGDEVTDVRYSDYASFANVTYARKIVVDRPKDLYGIELSMTTIQFNQPISDEKFQLEQPPGTQMGTLGEKSQPKKDASVD